MKPSHSNELGFIAQRDFHGSDIVIYKAAEQGIDVDGNKYAVVCTKHATIVGTNNLQRARQSMRDPEEFCEECYREWHDFSGAPRVA